jgi:hypothetical protein
VGVRPRDCDSLLEDTCWRPPALQVQDGLIVTGRNRIKARIAEIKADERYSYSPANVMVNAPLALIQVEQKSIVAAREWVLSLPGCSRCQSPLPEGHVAYCSSRCLDEDIAERAEGAATKPKPQPIPKCETIEQAMSMVERVWNYLDDSAPGADSDHLLELEADAAQLADMAKDLKQAREEEEAGT